MDDKKVKWYDNGNKITSIIIAVIFIIIISSQSFAVGQSFSFELLGSIINHNSIYLFVLVYFVFLKFSFGKKYFNYLNVGLFLIYFISAFTSLLTVVQSFSLDSLLDFAVSFILIIYMLHTLFRDTLVWKEFKFYSIVLVSFTLLIINLISTVVLSGVVISILDTMYIVLFGRYIYLYRDYLDKNKIDADNEGNFDAIKETIKTTVDDTTDKVKTAIEDAKIDEKINDAKETIIDTAKDVKEKLDDAADKVKTAIEDAKVDEKINDAKETIIDTAKDVKEGTTKFIKDNEIDKKVNDLKDQIDNAFDDIVDDIREKVGDIEDKVDDIEEKKETEENKKKKTKKNSTDETNSKSKSSKKEKGDNE
jgi:hypothetical protein